MHIRISWRLCFINNSWKIIATRFHIYFGRNLLTNSRLIRSPYFLNPYQAGGAKWPTANLNEFFSATECPIDLKPSCSFKFVRCLEVYKKFINLDLGGTLEGLLLARVPQNQPCIVNFRVLGKVEQ